MKIYKEKNLYCRKIYNDGKWREMEIEKEELRKEGRKERMEEGKKEGKKEWDIERKKDKLA